MEQTSTEGNIKVATFAGGCFWCMEYPYDRLEGVKSTVSGYTGGHDKNPTYPAVVSGKTGHREAIQITYDSSLVSYEDLLYVFWRNIDPVDDRGQFCDKGFQYTSAIFTHDSLQRQVALKTKRLVARELGKVDVVTEIVEAGVFFPAEDYHQDYYKKSSTRYKFYRYACGRDSRLKELWGNAAGGYDVQ